MMITIESFEPITFYHEEPEELIFREHRAYVRMRFDELDTEIGLIKEKLGITIERSESGSDLYEDTRLGEYRRFDEKRLDELDTEIGLIKEKLGITIESIEPVIGFYEDPEEAMLDEHREYVATEFDHNRSYVDMRSDKLVREIELIKEHLGT